MTASDEKRAAASDWFGQPRGLTILFLTEMWEVFSFVGMRTMLVYYMTRQLLIGQQEASLTYGLYSGFVYLTPVIGGILADRWLGRRTAVICGASIMAFGHFLMMFESLFHAALATVALGNGLFLPSLPSQISALYAPNDPRRQSAYSIYYMGKNLGAFLAPLVCGTLGELLGWHWGFGAAGVGMLLGLVIYVCGRRYLPEEVRAGSNNRASIAAADQQSNMKCYVVLAAIALCVVVFRSAYEQTGNTIALWLQDDVDRSIFGGLIIPMTWFQALNPLLVFVLTPLLVARWTRLGARGREPSAVSKMAMGAAIVACAFALLSIVAGTFERTGAVASWIWPMLFFAVLTVGELYILPAGLALFGRLAPPALAATIISFWYLTSFAGNLLAGVIGSYWTSMSASSFFSFCAALGTLAYLGLRMLRRPAQSLETREHAIATDRAVRTQTTIA